MRQIVESDELKAWEHYRLWRGVVRAVFAAPAHFRSETRLEGLQASDIFTLNTALAATIEESFVETLNRLRAVWDPGSEYLDYSFVRQAQTFPDVILRRVKNGTEPLAGIELKGWYLLAKEKEPTFRFTATEAACSPGDLLVVVPWALRDILSGHPVLYRPFVQTAQWCARERNRYWLARKTKLPTGIKSPVGVHPYPAKKDKISDTPERDGGGNFGRIARCGLMDEYVKSMAAEPVRGIAAHEWVGFFKAHARP